MQRVIHKSSSFIHVQTGRLLPQTLISFLLVGSLGVVVHMAILNAALFGLTSDFRIANGMAMLVAASFNYLLNNKSTFASTGLAGKKILLGYAMYLGITSLGLLASLFISTWVFQQNQMAMVAALCGIVIGSLWNYFMSYTFVWKLLSGTLRRN